MTASPVEGEPATEPTRGGPTALRIMLGAQLRALREEQGISTEEAGYAIRGSHSKISRMELGRVGFKERDITDLLMLYGVTDDGVRDAMLTLARQANTPGWWHQYGDVLPAWFEVYLGLEQAASLIRTYEVQFVPGLLQTEDYARAVIRLGHPEVGEAELDRRLAVRMARQRRLEGDDAIKIWAVVDEAALRRPIGGPDVMRGQLEHLIEMHARNSVSLQVLPFHAGGHAAAGGPFSLLRFAEKGLSDVVYLEQLTSALYLEKPADIDRYRRVIDQLSVEAAEVDVTTDLLERFAAEL